MQALLDLQSPTNTATSLRQLLDSIENHIRELESLGSTRTPLGISISQLYLVSCPQSLEETSLETIPQNSGI